MIGLLSGHIHQTTKEQIEEFPSDRIFGKSKGKTSQSVDEPHNQCKQRWMGKQTHKCP